MTDASVYAALDEQVLATMLQKAKRELFILKETEPDPGNWRAHNINLAFAQQNVIKITDALKIKASSAAEQRSVGDYRNNFPNR